MAVEHRSDEAAVHPGEAGFVGSPLSASEYDWVTDRDLGVPLPATLGSAPGGGAHPNGRCIPKDRLMDPPD